MNEALLHATWMKLENIILSGRAQTEKATCCMIPVKAGRVHRDRRQISDCSGLVGGGVPTGMGASLCGDDNALKLTMVMATYTCGYSKATELYA